ncbi:MAG: hypothetical protein Q8906_07705 [Bacillota bacterium]|nr:hypothetical protein [Bacillota bacterium]
MFSWNDLFTFTWSFLVVLPLVAVIHALGHMIFIYAFGGKGELQIGKGKHLVRLGSVKICFFYFIDSACQNVKIKNETRWKYALIYAGGMIFNLISIIVVNYLIYIGVFTKQMFFYQFVYSSVYYIFFALLPIEFGKDNPSDGKAIYNALKFGKFYKEFY